MRAATGKVEDGKIVVENGCAKAVENQSGLESDLEAPIGFEPMHKGFADLSLSHLGTAPFNVAVSL